MLPEKLLVPTCRRLGRRWGGSGGAASGSTARCGMGPFAVEEVFEESTSGDVRPERVCGTSGIGDVDVSPKSDSRLCF